MSLFSQEDFNGPQPQQVGDITKPAGLFTQADFETSPAVPGNIETMNRPVLDNPDGSISTTRSFSVDIDGQEVLLPSIVNGQQLSQEEAIQHYRNTGENLGKFNTPQEADVFAHNLSKQQGIFHQQELPKPGILENLGAAFGNMIPTFLPERDKTPGLISADTSSSKTNPFVASKYKPTIPADEDEARGKLQVPKGTDQEILSNYMLGMLAPMVGAVKIRQDFSSVKAVGNIPQAVTSGVVELPAAVDIYQHQLRKAMATRMGDTKAFQDLTDSEDDQGQPEFAAWLREVTSPRLFGQNDPNSYAEIIPNAFGQVVGFGGVFNSTKAASELLGASKLFATQAAGIATTGAGGILGGAQGVEDAKAHQATEEQINRSLAVNTVFGLSEGVVVDKMLNRFDAATGGLVSRNINKALQKITKGKFGTVETFDGLLSQGDLVNGAMKDAIEVGIWEGIQETGQQIGLNWNAEETYDPGRSLFDQAGQAGGVGFSVGALIGFFTGYHGRRLKGAADPLELQKALVLWDQGLADSSAFTDQLPPDNPYRIAFEKDVLANQDQVITAGLEAEQDILLDEESKKLLAASDVKMTKGLHPKSNRGIWSIPVDSDGVEFKYVDSREVNAVDSVTGNRRLVSEAIAPGELVIAEIPAVTPKEISLFADTPEKRQEEIAVRERRSQELADSFKGIWENVKPLFVNPLTGQQMGMVLAQSQPGQGGSATISKDGKAFIVTINYRQAREDPYKHNAFYYTEALGHELVHTLISLHLSPFHEVMVYKDYSNIPVLEAEKRQIEDVYSAAVQGVTDAVVRESERQKYITNLEGLRDKFYKMPAVQTYSAILSIYDKYRAEMQAKGTTLADFELASGGIAEIGLKPGQIIDPNNTSISDLMKRWPELLTKTPKGRSAKNSEKDMKYWQNGHEFLARVMGNQILLQGEIDPLVSAFLEDRRQEFKQIHDELLKIPAYAKTRRPMGAWLKQLSAKGQLLDLLQKRLEGTLSPLDAIVRLNLTTGRLTEGPEVKIELAPTGTPSDARPEATVGDNWTNDPGAMPGEPAQIYKGGKAALIEHQIEGTLNSVWEAVLENGDSLGRFNTIQEAAQAAEKRIALNKKPLLPAIPDNRPSGTPTNPTPPMNTEASEGDMEHWNTNLDKFNKWYSWGLGVLHLEKLNQHIKPLQEYVEVLRVWANERGKRIFNAQNIHTEWRRLGKEQANKLSKVLLEESIAEKFKTANELMAELDDEAIAVREKVKNYYEEILKAMEGLLIQEAIRKYSKDTVAQGQQITAIQQRFIALRGKPYFPLMRFGKYAVQIKDAKKKQIYFETFEKASERDKAVIEWKTRRHQVPAGDKLKSAKIVAIDMSDHMASVQGMPIDFAKLYIERLKAAGIPLTDEQIKQIEDLSFETSQAKGFLKQFKKRKAIPGFSTDGLRVFAAYALSASNHIARVAHAPRLAEHISTLRAQTTEIRTKAPESEKTVKRDQIGNWLDEHFKYLLTPENEWAGLRSAAFFWFLGFNIKTAILNTTQVPMVAYPYLAARYGDVKAVAALTKAYGEAASYYTMGAQSLTDGQNKLLIQGKLDGWLDEGMTTELAMSSREARLDRMLPTSTTRRFLHKLPQWSGTFFSTSEKMNRNVVALAAYDLAIQAGKEHQEAYFLARQAVETTQFEYARWNRAPLFRGKQGVVLIFMSFIQNQMIFALADPGALRWWVMMLLMGGLMGLPGAQDILDLLSFGWNTFSKLFKTHKPYKDFEVELRRYLKATVGEMGLNPDLMMHGLSRDSFGLTSIPGLESFPIPRVDLSGSLGMGNILPLTEDLKRLNADGLDSFIARGGESVGGAVPAGIMSILRAANSSDPDNWRRWEKALPTASRNASQALRLYTRGKEETQRGDVIAEFDPHDTRDRMELIMKAMSFQLTDISEGWEQSIAQRDAVGYYKIQKSLLLKDLNYARYTKDREGIADASKAIKSYNSNVPFPIMKISRMEANKSFKSYAKIHKKAGANVAMEKEYLQLERDLSGVFEPPKGQDIEDIKEESLPSSGGASN